VAAAEALLTGDPKDEATQLGPLASEEHYKKVRSYLHGIEADGGTIRAGGPATAGSCCPPWSRTPRRPPAYTARRCSAR
jgi:aminomuconate-semialdehyde/2-hydroxymuconate-6-semialdehyde dehydrogenase